LNRHIAEVNAEMRKQNPDASESESVSGANDGDVEWAGIDDGEMEAAQDEEYVDEDKYTTVTVEAMGDPSDDSDHDSVPKTTTKEDEKANGATEAPKKRIWNKENKAKPKKRKFRYESKAERQVTRQKQKSKNHAAKVRRKGK
jgi:ribosomal RNA-processing protein 17